MAANRFAVLVLGHGEMGRSMERLLGARHDLTIWERDLRDWTENLPLEQAAADMDFVLFTLPASPHRELGSRLRDHLGEGTLCASIAKGLDEQGDTPAAVLAETLGPRHPFAMLYGPMIAEELRAGRAGFAELGTPDPAVFLAFKRLFAGTRLYLRQCTDVAGLSWGVILKNVYVPLLGAADELQLGDNARGYLLATAAREIGAIIDYMGGDPQTAWGVGTLGDLVTTATSAGSHHRELGRALARGETTGVSGEGIHTLAMIDRHGLLRLDDFPLLQLVHDMVNHPRDIESKFERFLQRAFGSVVTEPS